MKAMLSPRHNLKVGFYVAALYLAWNVLTLLAIMFVAGFQVAYATMMGWVGLFLYVVTMDYGLVGLVLLANIVAALYIVGLVLRLFFHLLMADWKKAQAQG